MWWFFVFSLSIIWWFVMFISKISWMKGSTQFQFSMLIMLMFTLKKWSKFTRARSKNTLINWLLFQKRSWITSKCWMKEKEYIFRMQNTDLKITSFWNIVEWEFLWQKIKTWLLLNKEKKMTMKYLREAFN